MLRKVPPGVVCDAFVLVWEPSLPVPAAITAIPFWVRLIRGMVISFKEEQLVEAGRAMGATNGQLTRSAILPKTLSFQA